MSSFSGSVTLVGNVVSKEGVELRFAPSGIAVAKFGLAVSNKDKQGNEATYFVDVTCFGPLAENASVSLQKGTRVLVWGDPDPQQWEKEGVVNRKFAVIAQAIGPELRFAQAEVSRVERMSSDKPTGSTDPSEDPFA